MNTNPKKWSPKTVQLAVDLHAQLIISHENWHKFKGNSHKRTAELLSSALVQLLSGGECSDISALINQSLLWINNEIKDPGCPDH